jgi:hypothetical protein
MKAAFRGCAAKNADFEVFEFEPREKVRFWPDFSGLFREAAQATTRGNN